MKASHEQGILNLKQPFHGLKHQENHASRYLCLPLAVSFTPAVP